MSEVFSKAGPTTVNTMRQLLAKELVALNSGSASPGTGGFTQGNYAGIAPNFTPTSQPWWAVDTSNNHLWTYFSNAWHDTGIATS
jgi:hypothetical protein